MSRVSNRLASSISVVVIVAVMTVIWIFAVPPSAGPDEPSHIVRGAALVRGELDGERVAGEKTFAAFELPAEIGFPDPGCFAFQPTVPATCATSLDPPGGDAILVTRSADYPIWGHLLSGVGTLVPGPSTGWISRLLDALGPTLIVGAAIALAARRGMFAAGATILAVTPMAWFTIAVVNPSGLVIAGGIGLWTGIVGLRRSNGSGRSPLNSPRGAAWLAGVSWAAMVLPRRDGLVYAALILAIGLLVFDVDLRRVGRWPAGIAGAATLATLAWASRSDTNAALALFAAPLAPVAALVVRRLWAVEAMRARAMRLAASVALAVVALVGVFVVMSLRADGFDRGVLRAVINRTGVNLRQAIGDLGWLDTPVPDSAVFLWLLALGVLVGVGLMLGARRLLLAAGAIVVVGVVTSWTLTMLQNDATGTYWQGRYYLPLLAGAPIALGALPIDRPSGRRVGWAVGGVALLVMNVALAAAMRRFSVGATGSLVPTDWNTYDSILPPAVLLALSLVASVLLLVAVAGLVDASENASAVPAGVNIVGYHHVASGLGAIARDIHRSLLDAGVPCTAIDVAATDSPELRRANAVPDELYDTTVAVVAALQLPSAMAELPQVTAAQRRLIGYWFWELDSVPESHRGAIDTVDEIWAPTEFVRAAYDAAVDGSTPVRLMPTRIERPEVSDRDVAGWREEFTDAADQILFVVSLDLFSVIERKNPLAAIDAFQAAFDRTRTDVRLVIKTINGDQRPDDFATIEERAADDERIDVVDRYVSEAELDALIAAADCYVSLHRSEGLGLHLATAMWVGTPVIATRWSGNLDLMDDSCAAMIDATLVPVVDGRGAYPDTARWADPDIAQAAGWMRRIADDPARRETLAAAALARMATQPERSDVGRTMWGALRGAASGSDTTSQPR